MHRHNQGMPPPARDTFTRMLVKALILAMSTAMSMLCAGCAHINEPPLGSTAEDWTTYAFSNALTCSKQVCVAARGEGRVYVVNGQTREVGQVWVLGKGPITVEIGNPAIPGVTWTSIVPLQPGLWRLEVAITPTAPLQSYAQLERYSSWRGWMMETYVVFVNQGRVMLPNRAPPPQSTAHK